MNNNIRSSQVLSPFGIGQIVNFPGEQSYMICGLNLWDEMLEIRKNTGGKINSREFSIREPRLQKLLGVNIFISPFAYKSSGQQNTNLTIPGVRFPQWYHCTNSRCGAMKKFELTHNDKPKCNVCSKEGKEFNMIPLRFIAACSNGHIQDVPFIEWVHNGPISDENESHNLSYHAGSGSGDLNSIKIKCSCGTSRSLGGIMNVSKSEDYQIYNSALASIGLTEEEIKNISPDAPNRNNPLGQYCHGSRPWLGPSNMFSKCENHLQVLIRGGSNIHYADLVSALYLPNFDKNTNPEVGNIIERVSMENLQTFYNQTSDHQFLRMFLETTDEVKYGAITVDEAFSEIERLIAAQNSNSSEESLSSELELRQDEYNYILNERNSENADYKSVMKNFQNYLDKDFLEKYFENVVLIEKLKETRVFRSFARINPDFRVDISELSAEEVKWLPAIQVYGEGIFLQFKKENIEKWLNDISLTDYDLLLRYQLLSRLNSRHPEDLNPAFVMMHTFAHLLIKRLCFNCGYGSSSLRERIYFNSDENNKMYGILIYTSSGDSEGSLGGLVRQGKEKYLSSLIKDALADAEWCSADPVCSDIGQSSGQGPDNVNGSACHNCCLVPETSCEEFNTLLDRATVIGTLENPQLGYFKQ